MQLHRFRTERIPLHPQATEDLPWDLLRNVTAEYPNHVWGIDITFIRLAHGGFYLTAILDWYSRYIVS